MTAELNEMKRNPMSIEEQTMRMAKYKTIANLFFVTRS